MEVFTPDRESIMVFLSDGKSVGVFTAEGRSAEVFTPGGGVEVATPDGKNRGGLHTKWEAHGGVHTKGVDYLTPCRGLWRYSHQVEDYGKYSYQMGECRGLHTE